MCTSTVRVPADTLWPQVFLMPAVVAPSLRYCRADLAVSGTHARHAAGVPVHECVQQRMPEDAVDPYVDSRALGIKARAI